MVKTGLPTDPARSLEGPVRVAEGTFASAPAELHNMPDSPKTTQRTPGDPTASLKQFRAALNFLPREVQLKVRLLWLKGHCANAIELVDRELK